MIFETVPVLLLLLGGCLEVKGNCDALQKEKWSYEGNNGPDKWGEKYSDCSGRSQSPIAIDPNNVRKLTDGKGIQLSGYSPIGGKMENNGHTVQVTPTDKVDRSLIIDDVPYQLQQFHFHFGSVSSNGSEHLIANRESSMEMHLVHKCAEGHIAVLGILFQESSSRNEAIGPIVKELDNVIYKGQEVEVSDINIKKLLPPCTSPQQPLYYSYSGSLTTPACTEGLKWYVLEGMTKISTQQMKAFRKLYATKRLDGDCPLHNNVRPVQPLNGRQVVAYHGKCL